MKVVVWIIHDLLIGKFSAIAIPMINKAIVIMIAMVAAFIYSIIV